MSRTDIRKRQLDPILIVYVPHKYLRTTAILQGNKILVADICDSLPLKSVPINIAVNVFEGFFWAPSLCRACIACDNSPPSPATSGIAWEMSGQNASFFKFNHKSNVAQQICDTNQLLFCSRFLLCKSIFKQLQYIKIL